MKGLLHLLVNWTRTLMLGDIRSLILLSP
uniref:Uncharacterized protein n=1 Tax=Rhizophora mucronata TaxID=61149 RepID=A0A2P2P841_RHIMU